MENTTGAGAFNLPKTKILRIAALIVSTVILCRGPMLSGCFPAAISFITYMMSRSSMNIYLILPAAAGLLPGIPRGMDIWGDMAAMCVCGLLFASTRRMKLMLWHRAVMASSVTIVCISIYRLATGTVYKTGVEELLLEALIVFALVFIFDAFGSIVERAGSPQSRRMEDARSRLRSRSEAAGTRELLELSFPVVCLLAVNGMSLDLLVWPIILFMALWFLICGDTGAALLATTAGGVVAALMGQGQWGVMATVMLGILAASMVKRYSAPAVTTVFAAVCWFLGYVENGVVLGVDADYLLITTAVFLIVHWKFGSGMRVALWRLTGKENAQPEAAEDETEKLLQEKLAELDSLTELYATYLDSRSMLATQFSITGQILEDARWRASRQGRRAAAHNREKFTVAVAMSQCAATGSINGDCCGWQDIGNGRVVMVVSDGMGKGKKAAAESLMVTRTILSLLRAGATVDLTLKMINTIMLMKDDEDSYATVDLVMVDKHTAKAKFYKIGAAPTLIRRKDNVEEVKLSAVPLGIVNGLKIRYVETTLRKDDWIIMMSDGVSDGGRSVAGGGGEFLHHIRETAADVRSQDPQTMSDLILDRAADSYIGRERDDMTVMVAKVV